MNSSAIGPNCLKPLLKGKIVIFGIGNRLRGDDGIGPELIERLQGKINAVCIDGENAPEMYLGKIARESPDTLFVIDAVHLDRRAGDFQILSLQDLEMPFFTTHDLPLRFLLDQLRSQIQCDVYVIGVQPSRLQLGEGLSKSARRTISVLESILTNALPK